MPLFDLESLKDAVSFIGSIEKPKNKAESSTVAIGLVNETVNSVKAAEPVTQNHAIDILDSSVTDTHLLSEFEKLSDEKKLLLINSALKFNEKEIVEMKTKHLHAKEMIVLHLKSFVIKTLTYGLIAVGVLVTFIFAASVWKTGSVVETKETASFLSSFFSTIAEIIKVLMTDTSK